MRKTYKILSVILVVLMIFSIMPITASAYTYSGTCGDNLTWVFDDFTCTLTISGTSAMYDYDYYSSPWKYYQDSIKTVVIEDGVTTIGNYAFYSCNSLTSITIPDSVTTIGNYAFYYCTSLTSITIPDSVTTTGNYSFYGCSSLESVTIGNSVTTIGEYAFYGCNSLISVTIPDSVTTIGVSAFVSCDTLTNVTVDSNNQYFSNDECGVLFNKDKTTLVQYTVGNVRTSYTIPNGVIIIGNGAFASCVNITSVVIPNGVTTIGNGAFDFCENITSIVIPDSVTVIGDYVFYECPNLKDIYYLGTEKQWNEILIGQGNYSLTTENIHYKECEHDYKSVTIPPTCTEKGYATFTCNECGNIYVDDYIDATGHKLNWVVLSVASCQTNGVEHGYCENCSYYEVNTTPMTAHADRDDDGYCDTCHEPLGSTDDCECNCHKSGISNFFFKIALFFQKLFGSNKTCACGVAHY